MRYARLLPVPALLVFSLLPIAASAQRNQNLTPEEREKLITKRTAIEQELDSVAIIDRKVMVPMRDGKRMQADIYRPKDTSKKYPVIFSRTPYNFNYWDVRLGAPRDMSSELDAVKRGYVLIEMNERGHFFSEGNYDILGPPLTDSDDELNWMSAQPWSNGKVGLIGCSSTAEWQLAVAARGNKALAAFIPESFGAGVGRVGKWYEQGNWFRGGAFQMLFAAWIYGEQNQVRPMFPHGTTQQELIDASKMFDLAPQMPPVDWAKALAHLPEEDILKAVGGPKGIYADAMPVPTGGRMIQRTPNDPAWLKGGLWNDSEKINIPGLWFMTWYDVSTGPNLAAYDFVRRTAKGEVANEQYAVIAPTLHCQYKRATEHTVVGERDMGDARLDYDALDLWLVRSLPQGRGQRHPEEDAARAVLHHGVEQVAVGGHVAASGCQADEALPGQRGQRAHAAWRRRAGARCWRSPTIQISSPTIRCIPCRPMVAMSAAPATRSRATAARSTSARWKSVRRSWCTPPNR